MPMYLYEEDHIASHSVKHNLQNMEKIIISYLSYLFPSSFK